MPEAQCCSFFPNLGVGQAARAGQPELRPQGWEGGQLSPGTQGWYSRLLLAIAPPDMSLLPAPWAGKELLLQASGAQSSQDLHI